VYLPFELFCVVAEVVLSRLIGTILLALGAGVLLAWIRDEQPAPTVVDVHPEGTVTARTGSVSVAQLGVLLTGVCCVVGGLFLWTR